MQSTNATRRPVDIPAGYGFTEGRFHAKLLGITPLLMHNPRGMVASESVQRSGKKIPEAAAEAEAGAYRLPNGALCLPAVNIQRAMVEAGRQFKDPSYTRQTMFKPLAAALLPPEADGFPLMDATGEEIHEYEIDARRAIVQRNAIMRRRPRIDFWQCEISLRYDTQSIAPEMLAGVLVAAGSKVGVLDNRPEKGGPNGRFEVLEFEVED